MWKFKGNKGFTLIELLISITILSIVLISFFTFFTNTFRVNSMNSEGIQAMNVARGYKELIKEAPDISQEIENWSQNPNREFILERKDSNNPDYDVTISIPAANEAGAVFPIHRVHIVVQKDGRLLSETYTYYEPIVEETSSK